MGPKDSRGRRALQLLSDIGFRLAAGILLMSLTSRSVDPWLCLVAIWILGMSALLGRR